jgi:hypothetical protein
MAGVLASGTLYLNQVISGVLQGRTRLPGAAKLAIKPNSDLVEAVSKDKGKYGQLSMSVAINKPADFSVTLTEITGQALAIALQGENSTLSQSSGTMTSQAVTAKKGTYIPLGHRNIASAGFSVKDVTDTTTYVLGTDYSIDYVTGQLYIIPAGAIADAATIHVNGTYGAVSGTKVLGGTVPQVQGELFFDGINLDDGRPLLITIWDARLTADGEVDFLSDKPIELAMKGRMVTPTGKSSAYEIEYNLDLA